VIKHGIKVASIRVRLLIAVFMIVFVALGILAGVSYYLSNHYLTRSQGEAVRAIAVDYAGRIQGELRDKVIRLEDLANVPAIRKHRDKAQIMAAISEAHERMQEYDGIFFYALDGSGFRHDGIPTQVADREFFMMVVSTKKSYISKPLVSRSTGKLAVNIVVPVLDNGNLIGLLAGNLPLEKVTSLIDGVKFRDSGFAYLVDESGVVLGHPKMPTAVGKLNMTEKKIDSAVQVKQTELDDRLVSMFKATVKDNEQIYGKYKSTSVGEEVVSIFTPFDLPGGQRWVMGISVPESEVSREIQTLSMAMGGASVATLILAIIAIGIMSRRFAKPITLIRDECVLLAQGDLRERESKVQSEDEIGQLAQGFREMRANLRNLVAKVQGQAEQVAASSEELTASAHQAAQAANQVAGSIAEIADGAQKQAAVAAEITTVAEEMSATTIHVSETADQVARIAKNTARETEQGSQAVGKAIAQMQMIGQGAIAVQTAIAELARGSEEIRSIVGLISNIAGQTNLLALNAAIEAARAGEHGRGFAVVAEEVRKLAEESNKAAQQIRELIQCNQINMEQAIAATEAGTAGVSAGVEVVNAAGDTFNKIAISIVQLSEQVKGISESIHQMATGSQTMRASIREIDGVSRTSAAEAQTVSAATEETSAAMEEIASSSQSLANLAGELQASVAKFRI